GLTSRKKLSKFEAALPSAKYQLVLSVGEPTVPWPPIQRLVLPIHPQYIDRSATIGAVSDWTQVLKSAPASSGYELASMVSRCSGPSVREWSIVRSSAVKK